MEYHTKFAISKVHDLSSSKKEKYFNQQIKPPRHPLKSRRREKKKQICADWVSQQSILKPPNNHPIKAVKLKQEKALKFHLITNMEGYWEQTNGHATAPHPVKFERWESNSLLKNILHKFLFFATFTLVFLASMKCVQLLCSLDRRRGFVFFISVRFPLSKHLLAIWFHFRVRN